MSGLYNMVLGDGHEIDRGNLIISILGLKGVPRYRDSWSELDERGEARFAIYTRTGGNNRESYESEITSLQESAYYLSDRDDDFDSTYATFYFRIPTAQELIATDMLEAKDEEAYVSTIDQIVTDAAPEPVDMSATWKKAIDALKELS